jgi:hypothetical protein
MAWMVKSSKDERLRLIRLDPVPKVVHMEEIEGEEDEVVADAFIRCSRI